MTKFTVLSTCGALALSLALVGCKKEKDKAADKPAETEQAAKTAETPPQPEPVTPPEPAKPATGEEKVKFYQDCIAALNAKDWDKFGACYSEDTQTSFVDQADGELKGRADTIEKGAKVMADAFPDLKVTPQIILQSGDKIACVQLLTGTHTKALKATGGELPATDKKVGVYSLHMVELTPGKLEIAKSSQVMDEGSFAGQLGLYPGPHRPAADKGFADQTIIAIGDPEGEKEKANLALHQSARDAFAKRDLKGMFAIWADDARVTDMAMPGESNKKKAEAFAKELFKGFPDAKGEMIDLWAAGDYVLAVSNNTGKNTGPMPTLKIKKPTGKSIQFTEASITRFENGKAVESWNFRNGMTLAAQLGS